MKTIDQQPAYVRQVLRQVDGSWRIATVGPCALMAPPKPLVVTHVKKPFDFPSELDTKLVTRLVVVKMHAALLKRLTRSCSWLCAAQTSSMCGSMVQCDILVPESDDKAYQGSSDATAIDGAFIDAPASLLAPLRELTAFAAKFALVDALCCSLARLHGARCRFANESSHRLPPLAMILRPSEALQVRCISLRFGAFHHSCSLARLRRCTSIRVRVRRRGRSACRRALC